MGFTKGDTRSLDYSSFEYTRSTGVLGIGLVGHEETGPSSSLYIMIENHLSVPFYVNKPPLTLDTKLACPKPKPQNPSPKP